jgi:hypothetical protein
VHPDSVASTNRRAPRTAPSGLRPAASWSGRRDSNPRPWSPRLPTGLRTVARNCRKCRSDRRSASRHFAYRTRVSCCCSKTRCQRADKLRRRTAPSVSAATRACPKIVSHPAPGRLRQRRERSDCLDRVAMRELRVDRDGRRDVWPDFQARVAARLARLSPSFLNQTDPLPTGKAPPMCSPGSSTTRPDGPRHRSPGPRPRPATSGVEVFAGREVDRRRARMS